MVNDMEEIFVDILGYEGYYQVSNFGRVRSLDREVKHNYGGYAVKKGKILVLSPNNRGYFTFELQKQRKKQKGFIHKVVASAFIDNPESHPTVRHHKSNFDDVYDIKPDGTIISLKKTWICGNGTVNNKEETNLRQQINKKGYKCVDICINGKAKRYSVHRLVANKFIPNPNNLPQVNHKDCNKLNNHVDNLEWCTNLENNIHAIKNRLVRGAIPIEIVSEIRELYSTGKFNKSKLAIIYKKSKSTIGNYINNETRIYY